MNAKRNYLRAFAGATAALAIAFVICSTAANADSESGGFVLNGGTESSGFAPLGTPGGLTSAGIPPSSNESSGVLWGQGASESANVTTSGAESISANAAEVGKQSESGDPAQANANETGVSVRNYHW